MTGFNSHINTSTLFSPTESTYCTDAVMQKEQKTAESRHAKHVACIRSWHNEKWLNQRQWRKHQRRHWNHIKLLQRHTTSRKNSYIWPLRHHASRRNSVISDLCGDAWVLRTQRNRGFKHDVFHHFYEVWSSVKLLLVRITRNPSSIIFRSQTGVETARCSVTSLRPQDLLPA